MMISPEGYYEEYLKGKNQEQIMTAMRGLKQEIGRLKKYDGKPGLWRKAYYAAERRYAHSLDS